MVFLPIKKFIYYPIRKTELVMSRGALAALVVLIVVIVGLGVYLSIGRPAPELQSVRIALLYDPTNPVLNAQGEAAKLAIEEINAGGGILGVKVEVRSWNTMRTTEGALAAYREAVVDWGAQYVILEGVSEEMLALMEEGKTLYPQYPHVLMYCGMAGDVTMKVMENYDKYKFAFRIFDADYDANVARPAAIFWDVKNSLGLNKIAILIEDAAWTRGAREGLRVETKYGTIVQKPLREIAKDMGLEVVYEEKIPVGCKEFLSYLEAAQAKGAEYIFVLSSWYTDCTTLTKQWATSKARDIYLALYGGPNHWMAFWGMTGGAALGVLSGVFDFENYPPVSPYTQDFIKKMHEKGLRVDMSAHYYYSAVYHIKDAIEYVHDQGKDPNDINEVIKALEKVPCREHTMLPAEKAVLGLKENARFHSYPACQAFFFQFQGPNNVVLVSSPDNPYLRMQYSADFLRQYCHPELLKTPAQLRGS